MQLDQKALEAAEAEFYRTQGDMAHAIEVYLQAVQPVPVVTDDLPEIPDDDSDFTPELAREIIRQYQKLLTATAIAEPVAWQPIETAPKEGAYFIYQPAEKSGRYGLPARIVLNGYGGRRTSSHWMPLPAAPLPAQGGKADG